MLSDEEKKAIKGLEWSQQQMRLGNLPDYDQGHYADIRIVLNLIEKQSKEIEELKEKNKKKSIVIIEYQDLYEKLEDKIKEKIEEYKKQQKEEPDAYLCIIVLQSLLEKE